MLLTAEEKIKYNKIFESIISDDFMSKKISKEQIIQAVEEMVARDNCVNKVELFGSHQNGTATLESDVDLILHFNKTNVYDLFEHQFLLEYLLQVPVHLVNNQDISVNFAKKIEKNREIIYEKC